MCATKEKEGNIICKCKKCFEMHNLVFKCMPHESVRQYIEVQLRRPWEELLFGIMADHLYCFHDKIRKTSPFPDHIQAFIM